MAVLVSGGAGYIGSHTCVALLEAGYEIIVADDLRNSCREAVARVERITGKSIPFYETDLCHRQAAEEIFLRHPDIDAAIHFAGLKCVPESTRKPLAYYTNNLVSTLNLLERMAEHGVKNFVFSSSATVYGEPNTVPIREDFPTGGTTNPYGTSKLFQEQILHDCCAADPALNVALLRYFNPIGAHESGLIGEDPQGIPNNLMPYIAQVAVGRREKLHIFGDDYPTPDGTGVRDYIHVMDVARGHVAALQKLDTGCGLLVCNLGTGRGYSVLEVLHAYEKACGKPLPYDICPRRSGDVACLYADPTHAREALGWQAELDLDDMCRSSWKWQSMNPNGYNP